MAPVVSVREPSEALLICANHRVASRARVGRGRAGHTTIYYYAIDVYWH